MSQIITKIFKSPMALFVYGILSKWYITVALAAVVVAFWVFKGLSDSGILKKAEDVVFDALNQTKAVARFCVPKISDLSNFWNCLQNPPEYVPLEEEQQIRGMQDDTIDPSLLNRRKDPYEE